ncbi:MAG: UDP-N-acetylmuramate--L-alanine ligase, partial [Dehalococcoidia bacterium]|nr:UDP-N-acetylmuramate--L-alanine ligase [Dehalococcoidia bacterium]
NDADVVIVAEVYSAGEEVIEGINQETLVEGLRSHGHRHVESLRSEEVLAQLINNISFPGDMVVCLGAGSITNWANALPEELAALKSPSNQVCR